MRIGLVMLLLLVPVTATAQQLGGNPPTGPIVVANGTGTATGKAATATLVVGVQTFAEAASTAAEANAQKQNAVVAAIRKLGVPPDSIHTSTFSVGPEYRPVGQSRAPRYVVNNSVEIRTADLTSLGTLIDAALGAGANKVLAVRFAVLDPAALQRAALEDAVTASRRNAEAMAKALGGRIGDLIEVSNALERSYIPMGFQTLESDFTGEGPRTAIMPPDITASVTVATRWQFLKM